MLKLLHSFRASTDTPPALPTTTAVAVVVVVNVVVVVVVAVFDAPHTGAAAAWFDLVEYLPCRPTICPLSFVKSHAILIRRIFLMDRNFETLSTHSIIYT